MDETGAFCRSKAISEKEKPRIDEEARLVLGIVRRRFLETSLETERERALGVVAGEHLFADFTESGEILGEGVFDTTTIVGTEANRVVNFVSCMVWRNFFFCIFGPAGESETQHGVNAELVVDAEDVSAVGIEIPHRNIVVLEEVVE